MSKREILMRVAATLKQPFSRSQLVVACWRLSPRAFGLPGMEEDYPDGHIVQSVLYAKSGPLQDGSIVRVGELFSVKRAGSLPARLHDLWHSEAFQRFDNDRRELSFTQAMAFWGADAKTIQESIRTTETAIKGMVAGPERTALLACHRHLCERFARHIELARQPQRQPRLKLVAD